MPEKPSPPRRKKLIEVALPLEAINVEGSRRKRKAPSGYPTTLHWWYAQRPLAACRAVLFSSFVDDPESDPRYHSPDGSIDIESAGAKRAELFNLIEELVLWENSNNEGVINRARAEIARCVLSRKIETDELTKDTIVFGPEEGERSPKGNLSCRDGGPVTAYDVELMQAPAEAVNHVLATYAPPVLDPFAGGGSIPLEAQRLGLRAHASDLNPVAVLINKALIEIPPKFAGLPPVHPQAEQKTGWSGAAGLAEDVRQYGKWMRDEAENRIGHLYPQVKITAAIAKGREDLEPYVGTEMTVIAWLSCRTVQCPNPACGHRMPMARSFWLSKKKGKNAYADPVIDSQAGKVHFSIKLKGEPVRETSNRTMARCLFCGNEMKKPQLRAMAFEHGLNEIPLAIVAEGNRSRVYLEATDDVIPEVEAPTVSEIDQFITDDKRWFSPPQYGLRSFRDLFTPRQLTALVTFSDLVGEARAKVMEDAEKSERLPADDRRLDQCGQGARAYADAVSAYLACALSRCADYNSAFATWRSKDSAMRSTLGKQAIPMVWDFAEANPFAKSSGGLLDAVAAIAKSVAALPAVTAAPGKAVQATATTTSFSSPAVCCTDPPYYDNVGYADLSDFFYVWLRRTIGAVFPNTMATLSTPKSEEIIASPYRHPGGKQEAMEFFERELRKCFASIHAQAHEDFPVSIFYAFKQTENVAGGHTSTGWETFLDAVMAQQFIITGTLPLRTEGDNRQVSHGANALASSVVLICRKRPPNAPLATRREFVDLLRNELPDAIRHLQLSNIAPVDLAQAAIGPGMSVFSRFSRVLNADGTPIGVREALQMINQVLDESLSEQESNYDPWSRWAVAWFEQFGVEEEPYGTAETLSTAKGVSVAGVVEAGIARSGGGKVRLLRREELDANWDPATDNRLTIWEVANHLVKRLEEDGEAAAAALLRTLGPGHGETARELAYRLYQICERKKWAREALGYNSLVVAWPEIQRLSRESPTESTSAGAEEESLFNA